jgi:hypothetical protein
MNTMIAEAGGDQGFTDGRGILHEGMGIGFLIAVGLILLFAAGRLCRRGRGPVHAHAARYTSPRL